MKSKKVTYFPYLPNSKIEDNKRYKYIQDMMEKNPFAYHRKKNPFSFSDNKKYKIIENKSDNGEKNNKINKNMYQNNNNQEILIFQKDHDKYMNLFNNFMKKKTSKMEANAQNYLHFLVQLKKSYPIKKSLSDSNLKNIQSFSSTNKSSIINNLDNNIIPISNYNKGRRHFLLGQKSPTEINLFSPKSNSINSIESEKANFIANNVKKKNSDITNPFYYNEISKEFIKLNQEVMDYNRKESENKYKKKKKNFRYSNDEIALSPEKIKNPNYYDIGESKLEINPIINKGFYSMSYSRNYKNFNRHKSDLLI